MRTGAMLTYAETTRATRTEDIELLFGLETHEVQACMTPTERGVFAALGEVLVWSSRKLTPNWRAWAHEILARSKAARS